MLLIASAVAIMLLSFLSQRSAASNEESLDAGSLFLLKELGDGRPVLESPSGILHNRPIVVAAILPLKEPSFEWRLSHRGAVVCSLSFRSDAIGASFEASQRGTLQVTEAMVPFPDSSGVELIDGATYSMTIHLPNGHGSAPLAFTYQR